MASYNSPATSRQTEARFAGVLNGFGWTEVKRCMCGGSLKITYASKQAVKMTIDVRPSKGTFFILKKGRFIASGHENKLATTLTNLQS